MNARILVIDEEEGIRFTFENFLSAEGYEVETVGDYGEALKGIAEKNFGLIFADIIVEGNSGIDFLRGGRQRDLNCPIVLITGYPDIMTASEAVRLGAFDYIPKPVRKETLLRVARMALQRKALNDEKGK